jgi:hypothetical protein
MPGDHDSPNDEADGSGLSEDDFRRISAFADKDPDDRDPSQLVPNAGAGRPAAARSARDHGVSARRCKTMRRRMRDAETVQEVMEEYPETHTSEVMKHVYGDCPHSHEEPATASPQIGKRECRLFRERYAAGCDVEEISTEFYRADNTVTRHIFGRCSHENTPRPLSVSAVAASTCRRLRETYVGNPKVNVSGAATATGLRAEVAATHLFGYCSCDVETDAADHVETW